MSYVEYLKTTGKKDCKESWIDWKTECCFMSYGDARKVSYDPQWGYKPIKK